MCMTETYEGMRGTQLGARCSNTLANGIVIYGSAISRLHTCMNHLTDPRGLVVHTFTVLIEKTKE